MKIRPGLAFEASTDGGHGNNGQPVSEPDNTPPAQGDGADNQQPGPVPYERFKTVNDQLKQMQADMTKLQAAQKKAAEKDLADREQWKTLAEQREAELKTERTARSRLEIATRKGLPPDLAARLQGETPEEMEADADALLKFIKPATGPGIPPSGGGNAPKAVNLSNMTADEIRKLTPQQKQTAMQGS